MKLSFESGALVLLAAVAVATVLRRFRLPYVAGLAAVAIGLAVSPLSPRIGLTREVYASLIPPLVFTAAFSLDWRRVRHELALILSLGIGGTALSALIVALGMHYLARWGWLSSLMLAAIIAAADPLSVSTLFGKAKGIDRTRLLIGAESLISDAFAAVAAGLALTAVLADEITPAHVSVTLVTAIGGAVLCGAGVAGIALLATSRAHDSLVQIATTTAVAYGSFAAAERFHFSGVLAAIVAGAIFGGWHPERFSDRERETLNAFWAVAALLSSSFVFVLVGFHEVRLASAGVWFAGLVAIMLMLMGRACAVRSICRLFADSRRPVSGPEQHVLTLYGLRGPLCLALALCIPPDMQGRAEIISVCLIAVAFSFLMEGFTMPHALRRQTKELIP